MKISKSVIETLNPCKDRFDACVEHYGDREFTTRQFMGLKHVVQSDKLWVAFRLMPKENIALAAADIAESVLHLYESEYPNDDRPRKAIEAARSGDAEKAIADADAAAKVAYANAVNAVNAAAAYAAADAAAYAAAYATAASAAAAYAADEAA